MYYFVRIYFMKFHHFMICLYLSFLSCLWLILLLEHTEYEKMCTAPLRDYRMLSLAVIFQSSVAELPLTLCLLSTLFTQLFCCICCTSRCLNILVRNTATLLTVYLSVFSLLKG